MPIDVAFFILKHVNTIVVAESNIIETPRYLWSYCFRIFYSVHCSLATMGDKEISFFQKSGFLISSCFMLRANCSRIFLSLSLRISFFKPKNNSIQVHSNSMNMSSYWPPKTTLFHLTSHSNVYIIPSKRL